MERVVIVGGAPIARLGARDLLHRAGIDCRPDEDAAGASAVVVQLDDPGLPGCLTQVRRRAPRATVVAVSADRPVLRVARRPTRWALRCARDRPLTAMSFVDAVRSALGPGAGVRRR